MADTNGTYTAANTYVDVDSLINNLALAFSGSQSESIRNVIRESLRKSPEIALLRKWNEESTETIAGVKVPFTGSTSAERVAWVKERITAIDKRVAFIRGNVDRIISRLREIGSSAGDVFLTAFVAGASAIPVVGTAFSFFGSKVRADNAASAQELAQSIGRYTDDVAQLSAIRKKLAAELETAPAVIANTPISDAPNIRTDYIIYGLLFIALIAFLWYQKNRR